MHKGQHLLIDCRQVSREVCLNDKLLLETMADAARSAGATVVSQIRYRFGEESPAGCTAVVMLDESHCSVHTYAELGLLAMDIFTCGDTDPKRIWERIQESLQLDQASIREYPRFETEPISQTQEPDPAPLGRGFTEVSRMSRRKSRPQHDKDDYHDSSERSHRSRRRKRKGRSQNHPFSDLPDEFLDYFNPEFYGEFSIPIDDDDLLDDEDGEQSR